MFKSIVKIKRLISILTLFVIVACFAMSAFATARYEVLIQGDDDKYVLRLQKELFARGYLLVEPTGYFGVETQKALVRYQSRNGLEADGKAGPETLKKIYGKNYLPMPETRNVGEIRKTDFESIRLGDEGSAIKKIQTRLKELGYYKYNKITSYYGPVTQAAIQSFQRVNKLNQDGVCGKVTYALLMGKNAKKAPSTSGNNSAGADKNQQDNQAHKGESKTSKFIRLAKAQLGKRYRTAATGPNTFDCSGFVYYVLKLMNISPPRTSKSMSANSAWEKIASPSALKKGDLVFFSSPSKSSGVGHVGIYLGSGDFIHCSSGSKRAVIISTLSSGSYQKRFQWGRRIF